MGFIVKKIIQNIILWISANQIDSNEKVLTSCILLMFIREGLGPLKEFVLRVVAYLQWNCWFCSLYAKLYGSCVHLFLGGPPHWLAWMCTPMGWLVLPMVANALRPCFLCGNNCVHLCIVCIYMFLIQTFWSLGIVKQKMLWRIKHLYCSLIWRNLWRIMLCCFQK